MKTQNHTNDIYDLMLSSDMNTFNQKFTAYEGKKLTIQDVVSIINLAKDCNRKSKMPVELKITCENGIIDGISEIDLLSNSIDLNTMLSQNIEKEYKCKTVYSNTLNLIEKIEIKKYE